MWIRYYKYCYGENWGGFLQEGKFSNAYKKESFTKKTTFCFPIIKQVRLTSSRFRNKTYLHHRLVILAVQVKKPLVWTMHLPISFWYSYANQSSTATTSAVWFVQCFRSGTSSLASLGRRARRPGDQIVTHIIYFWNLTPFLRHWLLWDQRIHWSEEV